MINPFKQIKKFIFYFNISLIIGLALTYPQTSTGITTGEEEIFINADHMHLSIESGNSIYTGNVKISQGKLILSGDKIIVQQENNLIKNITVTGKPARYNHVSDDGKAVTAESEEMLYNASENQLVLTTNATLEQPNHRVSSQKIIYDTEKRIIIAGDKKGASDARAKNNRVNITLTPKKQEPAKE